MSRGVLPMLSSRNFIVSGLPFKSLIHFLVYFCFYFHYSRRWVKEDLAEIYVKECSVFSSKSFIVSGLTFRSKSILSLFLCMMMGNVLISPF